MAQNKEEMTEQELNLWVSHMQTGNNRDNLLKWAAAMVEAGLKPEEYAEDMARFTKGLVVGQFVFPQVRFSIVGCGMIFV